MRPEIYLSAATVALLLAASAASAETIGVPVELEGPGEAALLSDVVVTANRSAQAADRVGQSVTVLTTAQIEASQTVVVADLLARTPGVTQSGNGGPGSATSLRIRGAETDRRWSSSMA